MRPAGILLPANDTSNVYAVVKGRINIEEYCTRKILRQPGPAFNSAEIV